LGLFAFRPSSGFTKGLKAQCCGRHPRDSCGPSGRSTCRVTLNASAIPSPLGRRVSKGSCGWDGAYGTHFWGDPREKRIGVMMIQTDNPDRQVDRDFENALMQAMVE